MVVRRPVVAGQFYPQATERCREDLLSCVASAPEPGALPRRLLGGIVPHAGWMCSGHLAAAVFKALAGASQPETIVMFGAAHRWAGKQAAMFCSGRWETPLGSIEVDDRLAQRVLGFTNVIADDPYAHQDEHALEVQMPFVKHFLPQAKVLPITVPPSAMATEVGEAVARTLEAYRSSAVVVGTTDLTHYGRSYHFEPHGPGEEGRRWAKEVNDRRIIDLMESMAAERVVPEALEHHNACGAGAVAATVASVAHQRAEVAVVLEHTTRHEVLQGRGSGDAVGYVGMVYGRN